MAALASHPTRSRDEEQQLLELEMDAIFDLDHHDGNTCPTLRHDDALHAVHIHSSKASSTALHPNIKGHIISTEALHQSFPLGTIPPAITELQTALNLSPESITGGPSFLFPPHRPAPKAPSTTPIIVSDIPGKRAAQLLTRPSTWELDEWTRLTHGKLGEWAMAIHDGSPVSVCFSARRRERCAEAGVWTREDFRGRGLAPLVVAAWASREDKDVLFYSISGPNPASHSVARTLGLEPLGWIWKLRSI